MNEGLISVIVPVYNVEKYLDRCVRSIVDSEYKNLQIILVDDGSFDNSPKLCDKWRKADKRIEVIHKSNGGLSSARNAGLQKVRGEYISFIDSDDYIHPQMFQYLMENMQKDNSDVAVCGVEEFYENGKYRRFRSVDTKILLNEKETIERIFTGKLMIAVMNRLYHKDILENIKFVEGKLYEDVLFDTDLFLKSGRKLRISILPNTGYYYFRRNDSIMGKTEKKGPSNDLFFAYEYLFKYVKKYNEQKMNRIVTYTTYYLISFVNNRKVECTIEFKNQLREFLSKYGRYISISEVGIRYKLKILAFQYLKM